jgi:CDP-diacylglycerol---glycerol-3-phosphate 3-phosphatidyltransferase
MPSEVDDSVDVGASIVIAATVAIALSSHAIASAAAGRALTVKRVERERGLPLLGKAPMHAVYRALIPIGRLLALLGVSANAVTVFSLVVAVVAAIAIGLGHLGVGALVACIAALADAVDGIVARESGTTSSLGRVLDTTVDRYVDALLLGGLAVHVRHDVVLLVVVLAAIVGSFMVSYASSVERELGVPDSGSAIPMRRAHRLAYILTGAALGPVAGRIAGPERPEAALVPMLVAVVAIAIVGNASAVRRLIVSARSAPSAPSAPSSPDSAPDVPRVSHEVPR